MTFDDLRKLATGYQPARLFTTAHELGVFKALGGGALTAEELSGKIGTEPRATGIMADGLTALGLLAKNEGRYENSEAAARWLVETSPDYRGSIISHVHNSWRDYTGLAETMKCGKALCERKEGTIPKDPAQLAHFILGMENMTREAAPMLAGLLPLSSRRKILDIGAGPGNYLLAFGEKAAEARLVHFDLPETSAVAREFTSGKPGSKRLEFVEGDFLKDSFGEGFDFIWLSQVLHMLGETDCENVVKKAAAALVKGGVLAIHDHFLNEDKTSPASAALFGVHMLAVTEGGRSYSFAEMEELFKAAGLKPVKRLEYGGPSRVLIGEKL